MNELEIAKLTAALTEKIDEWWDGEFGLANIPLMGENTTSFMAQAAIAVLKSVSDSQDYLRGEGMLKDD